MVDSRARQEDRARGGDQQHPSGRRQETGAAASAPIAHFWGAELTYAPTAGSEAKQIGHQPHLLIEELGACVDDVVELPEQLEADGAE